MAKSGFTPESLVLALSNKMVIEAFKSMLQPMFDDIRGIVEINVKNIDANTKRISQLDAENKQLSTRIDQLEKTLSSNINSLGKALFARVEHLDIRGRNSNLVIHGFKESYAEASTRNKHATTIVNTEDSDQEIILSGNLTATASGLHGKELINHLRSDIRDFIKLHLAIDLLDEDIITIHRMHSTKPGPRPVIMQLLNQKVRDTILSAKSKLHGKTSSPIYINEHLTKQASLVLSKARQLFKAKRVTGAWVRNGTVYIKTLSTASTESIIRRIETTDDLYDYQ